MTELLLLSNSTSHGQGFLAHALDAIAELVPAGRGPLFVPYAGGWLRVTGSRAMTGGTVGSRLFSRAAEPRELPPGADVSELLATRPRFDTARAD